MASTLLHDPVAARGSERHEGGEAIIASVLPLPQLFLSSSSSSRALDGADGWQRRAARCSLHLGMDKRLLLLVALVASSHANHYRTLGVQKDASADAIKAAFRKIALKHHPDRLSRSASRETRQASTKLFEQANAAFEVLGDPAQRRQYDFELENPIQQGADGIHRQGAPGGPRRPRIEVQIFCGLAQLGGWQPAGIPLAAWSTALGATVTDEIAQRLGLPRSLYLPPGSVSGDAVRYVASSLGPIGCDIDFIVVATPHRRWRRKGDALHLSLKLPCYHNAIGSPAVRLAHLDGDTVVVIPRGQRVGGSSGQRSKGHGRAKAMSTVRLAGRGMPIRATAGADDDDDEAGGGGAQGGKARDDGGLARGDLSVALSLRTVQEEVALAAARLAACAAAIVAAKTARTAVPALVGFVYGEVSHRLGVVRDFLTDEVFGRARPQARAARLRARDDRRRERQRRRAARQAERDRRERERRWRQLKARTTDPIAKRVEAGKAAVAKGERERAAKRREPPKQQLPRKQRQPTPSQQRRPPQQQQPKRGPPPPSQQRTRQPARADRRRASGEQQRSMPGAVGGDVDAKAMRAAGLA